MIELRSSCTTEYLLDIEDPDVLVLTRCCIVHLGSLDDNCIGWQINTPSKSGCGDEYLNMTFRKEFLDKVSIFSKQPCIVNAEAIVKELLDLLVPRSLNLLLHSVRSLAIKEVHVIRLL